MPDQAINPEISGRLRAMAFLMAINIVFSHGTRISENESFYIFNGFFSAKVFFAISGYVLFRKESFTFENYIRLIKKRVKTLMVPYLMWSGAGLACFLLPRYSWTQWMKYFNEKIGVEIWSTKKLLYMWVIHPVPYQLWYVRSLFLFVMGFPFMYLSISRLGIIPVVIIFLFKGYLPIHSQHVESFCFFYIGGWIGLRNLDISNKKVFAPLWLGIWLIIAGAEKIMQSRFALSDIFGMIAIWENIPFFIDVIKRNNLLNYLRYSFFIFLFHQPFCHFLSLILVRMTPDFAGKSLFIYMGGPLITIITAIITAFFLSRKLPNFYSAVTGNR
ncbi:MAG: acyltransferase family protein [Thermodesulfovibrionales bacterium]